MNESIILGVDIGGTHITAALVDLNEGIIIPNSLCRKDVNSNASAPAILAEWSTIIQTIFAQFQLKDQKLGIAFPGPFDYEQGVSMIQAQDKFKDLYQVNIKEELAKRLKINSNQIKMLNDAEAFLSGEVNFGAAKGYQNAIGLTLGTGLGSAVAINGKAVDAQLWQTKFLNGIAEDYLATDWFIKKYKSLTDLDIAGVKELAAIANEDPYARQIFNEFGRALGHFLADFVRQSDSKIIILGGNIAKAYHLFENHLKENLFAYHLSPQIVVTQLDETAALIGAASLWLKK